MCRRRCHKLVCVGARKLGSPMNPLRFERKNAQCHQMKPSPTQALFQPGVSQCLSIYLSEVRSTSFRHITTPLLHLLDRLPCVHPKHSIHLRTGSGCSATVLGSKTENSLKLPVFKIFAGWYNEDHRCAYSLYQRGVCLLSTVQLTQYIKQNLHKAMR